VSCPRAWVWLAVVASATACNLVLGIGSYRPCDGAECTDAEVVDASPDVGTPDAPADAGDADAPGTGFCANQLKPATFCEDFDEGPFYAQFDKVATSVGTVATDSQYAESPPNAVAFALPLAAPGLSYAYLTKAFAGTWAHATLDFWFRPDALPNDHSSDLAASIVVRDASGDLYTLSWSINGPDDDQVVQAIETPDASTATFQSSNALTVAKDAETVELDLDMVNHVFSLSTNGVPQLSNTLVPEWPSSGAITIVIGLNQVTSLNGATWIIRFDDVRLTLK